MALTKPFAANGDKTPIKLDTTADGVVNYENGFGARYSMPIKAVIDSNGNITKTGGLQIERGQMNQILNDFSSAIIENQEGIGDLSSLRTTAKDNLVGAINENFSNIQVNKNSINNIKGQISTTNNNIGSLRNLTTTNKSNIVSAINEVNNTTPKLLTQSLTWDVANETQLREALNGALKLKKDNIAAIITLRMTDDIVLAKPIIFTCVDCRNIIIDGQKQFKVQKNMSELYDRIFYGIRSAFLPELMNLEISNTTATNQYGHGIVLYHNSNINLQEESNVTVKNVNIGILIAGCSVINARTISIDSCNIGVRSYCANVIDLGLASIKNCNIGIRVNSGGGVISANRAVFENNTTDCSIPFNQVTADGIVFK